MLQFATGGSFGLSQRRLKIGAARNPRLCASIAEIASAWEGKAAYGGVNILRNESGCHIVVARERRTSRKILRYRRG